jgi:predicted GIY-YIG superfamily endonuclease
MNPAPSDILEKYLESKKYAALCIGYTNDMKRRLEQQEGAG